MHDFVNVPEFVYDADDEEDEDVPLRVLEPVGELPGDRRIMMERWDIPIPPVGREVSMFKPRLAYSLPDG